MISNSTCLKIFSWQIIFMKMKLGRKLSIIIILNSMLNDHPFRITIKISIIFCRLTIYLIQVKIFQLKLMKKFKKKMIF